MGDEEWWRGAGVGLLWKSPCRSNGAPFPRHQCLPCSVPGVDSVEDTALWGVSSCFSVAKDVAKDSDMCRAVCADDRGLGTLNHTWLWGKMQAN